MSARNKAAQQHRAAVTPGTADALRQATAEAHAMLGDLNRAVKQARAERDMANAALVAELEKTIGPLLAAARKTINTQVSAALKEGLKDVERVAAAQQEIVEATNEHLRKLMGLSDPEEARKFLKDQMYEAVEVVLRRMTGIGKGDLARDVVGSVSHGYRKSGLPGGRG